MWHEASYGIDGRHSENKATVAQIEREEKLWAQTMAKFSKKTEEFWLKEGIHIDAFFNSDQLLEMGVVDEII